MGQETRGSVFLIYFLINFHDLDMIDTTGNIAEEKALGVIGVSGTAHSILLPSLGV